jgi:hypothetical protein
MSLRKEVSEIKGTLNKIYEHIVVLLKLVDHVNDHGRRIERLEGKVERLEANMTNIKVHGCEPIVETDVLSWEELGKVMNNKK